MLPYSDSTNAYLYLKTDFNIPADEISLTCLDLEIDNTLLNSIYEFALTEEDDTHILFMFTRRLDAIEEAALDTIVQSHTGRCNVESTVAETHVTSASDYEVLMYDSTSQMFVNRFVDHDHLENLEHDVHTQYIPRNGSRELTADWDSGDHEIRADGGFRTDNLRVHLAPYANISGVLTGGELTINSVDNTLVDVAAGTGIHCHFDVEVAGNPRVHTVSWEAQTIDPQLETSRSRWIAIQCNEGDGTAVIRTEINASDRRDLIVIGRCWGPGTGVVTTVKNYTTPAFNYGKTLEDVMAALGSINITGNVYTPSSSAFKLQRSAGQSFRFTANYTTDPTSPNVYDSSLENPVNNYSYHVPGQLTTISKTGIDPEYYYDDTTAELMAVPAGKWTIQRVYYFPVSNTTHITYGEEYFDSESLAYDGIIQNDVNLNTDILSGSILRAYLILQQGCTNLNSTKCNIVPAYTDPGLVPGYTNHGQLGGLEDDDHPQYIHTNATRGMDADWDAGDIRITADGGFTVDDAELDAARYLSITGKIQGGLVSQNAIDDQTLDVTAGTAIVVNLNDPTNPRVKQISWDAFTFDPGLDDTLIKWVGLEYNWATGDTTTVVDVEFTTKERRSIVVLARVWGTTPGSTEITNVANYATPAYMPGKSLEDLTVALGTINYSGNEFSAADVAMKLKRTAGRAFRFAANYDNDPLDPNMYNSVDEDPINTYFYQKYDSERTTVYSAVQPDFYQDSTGNISSVPTDKWTVQKIYYYPVSNVVSITWGTTVYDTKSLARDGLVIDNVNFYNVALVGAVLRGYLIVKEGATDLKDTNQAEIVLAYSGESGLVPGYTNHGQLGGLEDDDHPQYHNDTRGDALYYRKEYIEQAENIKYTYPSLTPPNYPFNVKTALDWNQGWIDNVGYSGRVSPEVVLVADTTNVGDILVLAGTGYISDGDQTLRIIWDEYRISNAGYLAQGNWYAFVDTNGDIQISQVFNTSFSVIRLGLFFSYGNGNVSSIVQCPCYINSAGNRIIQTLYDLGPFIHDDSGKLQVSPNNNLALTAAQASVNWALDHYTLDEVDTVDDIDVTVVRNVYRGADSVWKTDNWFSNPNGGNGIFPPDRYNDITADSSSLIVASFTFTNGSSTVTVSGDYTGIIDKDDFIYLASDGSTYMNPIEDSTGAIVFSGGTTTITLDGNYTGTGGTGNAIIDKALPRIPNDKYAKHIVFRVMDGDLISVYGNELFDTENDAKEGALPDYPASVKVYDVQIAYLLANPSLTSWAGNIYDLRPIPFYREGGGGAGGGAVVTVHGELSGLDADDHLQYLRTDGTRALTGTQKYASQPTFSDEKALITKKYVDDYFPVDHTTLTNIGTNTHAQIDTHIANTAIHKENDELDHNLLINTHNLTTNIDHTQISNVGTNTHAQIDTHIANTTIHFTKASISHTEISNIGTNTHAQIDTHISDTTIHFTKASIDHNAILNTHNLTTDIDHDLLTNTHNLTTDIDHNQLTNTHNLTTDIDHNQLTNYDPNRHFLWSDITAGDILGKLTVLYTSSNALSSTTSTTYQNKLTLSTPAVAGTYRVAYAMEYNSNSNNKDVEVRFYDNTNASELGNNSQQTNNSANWFSFNGFYHFTQGAAATQFILQYRAGTTACSVRNARLEIWRVA